MKNLYLLERPDEASFDNYKSAIVCAESEFEAVLIHPSGDNTEFNSKFIEWIKPEEVIVKLIGIADKSIEIGVILSSYKHS